MTGIGRGAARISTRGSRTHEAGVRATARAARFVVARPRWPRRVDAAAELDPGLAKDGRDLELPPWNKGRYGTAIGRAVHAVLQTVDLATGAGLDDAAAAQAAAEGVLGYEDDDRRARALRARQPSIVAARARRVLARDVRRRPGRRASRSRATSTSCTATEPTTASSSSTTRPTRSATRPTSTRPARALPGAGRGVRARGGRGDGRARRPVRVRVPRTRRRPARS